jgi:SAM-dependent methyltransferase
MPLKMFSQRADSSEFWEEHWETTLTKVSLQEYYNQHFLNKRMLSFFEKYLPKKGRIVEGGCGLAPWVYVLRKEGYEVEGIDYAEKTVEVVKKHFPELPVKVGDVFNLEYPDNSVSGYISLGVVEHFEEGPQRILKEARRILKDEGVFICSVPYFNPLRKLKHKLGFYKKEGEFYQYAFTKGEMEKYLSEAGFKVIAVYYFDPLKGLKDEVKFLKPLIEIFRKSRGVSKKPDFEKRENEKNLGLKKMLSWFKNLIYLNLSFFVGHMMLMICEARKKGLESE